MSGKAWLGALCDRRWLCGFGVLYIIWRRTSNKVLGWPYEIVWRLKALGGIRTWDSGSGAGEVATPTMLLDVEVSLQRLQQSFLLLPSSSGRCPRAHY